MADQAIDWAPAKDMTSHEDAPHRVHQAIRTALDPLLAIPLLILSLPLLAVIAVAICLDSPGPAFFRQQRVGRNAKPFTIWKFRTLAMDAPAYSLKVAGHHPAVTRLGRFLRTVRTTWKSV